MDEEILNHHQPRHIYVHEKSTQYRFYTAEKRDSLARIRQGLPARGHHVFVSPFVFAQIKR